jgi:hypothetical protein
MILTLAELLKSVVEEERRKLDSFGISHGPTIGKMYEGLSKELLQTTVPPEFGLRVVDGFAYYGDKLSRQIDCMLVRGQ